MGDSVVSLQAWFQSGVCALSGARWMDAVECFRRILAVSPRHMDTARNLSLALEGAGRIDESVALWSDMLVAAPGDFPVLMERSAAYIRQGNFDLARNDLKAALNTQNISVAEAKKLVGMLQLVHAHVEATALCERILASDPDDIETLGIMAGLASRLGDYELSALLASMILQRMPEDIAARLALGNAMAKLDRFDEARGCFAEIVEKTPDSFEGWQALGLLESQLMRHEQALDYFDRALVFSPGHALTRFNRSLSGLALGNYLNGFKEYDARFSAHVSGVTLVKGLLPSLQWDGSDISGKRILILHEQGLGDSLQFIRFALGLKDRGAQVLVRVPPPLMRLFSRAPGVDAIFSDADPLPSYDAFVYMMSLPARLDVRQAVEQDLFVAPYLSPDPQDVIAWGDRLRHLSGFRVGLVWSGAPRKGFADAVYVDQRRSLRLETLLPLAQTPGVSFVSVQKGDATQALLSLADQWSVLDLTDQLQDFADTAALLANLDLLITVDTSVAHLAGGMGVPVWVLNRFDADWRWLVGREDSPWYPSMRLFNQRQMGDWTEVIERVASALREQSQLALGA